MALKTDADYAQEVVDNMATNDPDGFGSLDADQQNAIRDGLALAISQVILSALADARVSFVSGDFGGADSAGDTPDTITASNGTIA